MIYPKIEIPGAGYIQLVDSMGTDDDIADAARISYGDGTRSTSDNTGLIRYLMRNWHTSPFEMCELKLKVRVPMDTWRQWIRHRTASVNEYSTRYSFAIDEMQKTAPDAWRSQSKDNKQGSGEYLPVEVGQSLSSAEVFAHDLVKETYLIRIDHGVAREQARKDLPLSTYTEAIWKIDLHNLLHFLQLRMDAHAQKEIRDYADAIGNIVSSLWPITWRAFLDYRLNAISLSALDVAAIRAMGQGAALDEMGASERNDFRKKIAALGLTI